MQVSIIQEASAPTAGVMASTILFAMGYAGYGLLALLGGYVTYLVANRNTSE